MFWHGALGRLAGIRTRRMEKRPSGAAGAVHHIFGQHLVVVRIVVILVPDNINQASPAMPDSNDLIALAERAIRDAANRGVQSGDVSASGQNSDDALFCTDVSHVCATFSVKLNR